MILLASCEHRPSEVISRSRATLVYSGVSNNRPDEFVSAASRPKKIRPGIGAARVILCSVPAVCGSSD